MGKIGYHASHEQFKPSDLLKYVQLAEQAGFNLALSSDHFNISTLGAIAKDKAVMLGLG